MAPAWTAVAGAVLGVMLILSPLSAIVGGLAVLTLLAAARGLPREEGRRLVVLLVVALAARLLIVLALLLTSIPTGSAQNAGILFGDEVYSLGRSLRTRNVLLGVPASKYDYEVMFDTYARTRYMSWLSWLQLTFGPSPYSIRLLNGVIFVAGATWLYRLARRGFGVVPAFGGLAALLFLPSLLLWSVSLLKESVYFLSTVAALAGGLWIVRGTTWSMRAGGAVLVVLNLWLLADLRPGAVVLTGGALVAGVAAWWMLQAPQRILVGAAAVVVVAATVWRSPSVSARVLGALTAAAKQHTGHVFTVGHAYKTLDDKFYGKVDTPSTSQLRLTAGEAARYVVRSGWSFITVPFPWQVATRSELAFVPEQLVWYLLVVTALAGLWPAWRRDPLLTAVLAAYVVLMAGALALTNGNVGTLVRLRGLVMPFLVWLSALGCAVVLQHLVESKKAVVLRA